MVEDNKLCGRPLTFGDNQQIEALKEIPTDQVTETPLPLKTYKATLIYHVVCEVDVQARNEHEAEDEAEDGIDLNSGECILESIDVVEI